MPPVIWYLLLFPPKYPQKKLIEHSESIVNPANKGHFRKSFVFEDVPCPVWCSANRSKAIFLWTVCRWIVCYLKTKYVVCRILRKTQGEILVMREGYDDILWLTAKDSCIFKPHMHQKLLKTDKTVYRR